MVILNQHSCLIKVYKSGPCLYCATGYASKSPEITIHLSYLKTFVDIPYATYLLMYLLKSRNVFKLSLIHGLRHNATQYYVTYHYSVCALIYMSTIIPGNGHNEI